MRTIIAAIAAGIALLLMGLVLFVQYAVTSTAASAVHDALSPAADASASLTLAQANASGALSDYIMLKRPASLDDYRASVERSSVLLDQVLAMLPPDQPGIRALVTEARATQREWISTDAAPVIALLEAGKRTRAMRVTNSPEAWQAYEAMTVASTKLNQAVNDERDAAATALATVNSWLGTTLIVVGILILLGLLVFLLGLQRWVLAPLTHLRSDLQSAARHTGHETPIAEVGPPELRAVSVDAETLRRGLVKEIDEARAAREGLAQDAPLVAAMESGSHHRRMSMSTESATTAPASPLRALSPVTGGIPSGAPTGRCASSSPTSPATGLEPVSRPCASARSCELRWPRVSHLTRPCGWPLRRARRTVTS